MGHLRTALSIVAIGSLLPAAWAATSWICGLSDDGTRLVCIADQGAVPDEPARATAPTVINGTRFPLDPKQVYTVNLWSPPTELAPVRLLAQSTVCYRSPGCEVVLSPGPWINALSAPAANDPRLAQR